MNLTKAVFAVILALLLVFSVQARVFAALEGPEEAIVIKRDAVTNGPSEKPLTNCKILLDEYDKIKIRQMETGDMTFKADEIYDIIPSGTGSGHLPKGIELYKEGLYEQAVEKIKSAKSLYQKKQWVQIYCTYYMGMCYLSMGGKYVKKGQDMLALFEKNKKWKKHRLVPWALYGTARSAKANGKYSDANKAFSNLEKKKDFGLIWQLTGKAGKGEVAFAQKNYDSAKKMLSDLEKQAARNRNTVLMLMAKAYQAKCWAKQGNVEKAKNIFEDLIKEKNASKEVKAAAYNGLGEYYYSQKGGRETKKALICHLRVAVLYSTVRDEYAKALYLAAKCFDELGQKARAKKLRDELKKRCPGFKPGRF